MSGSEAVSSMRNISKNVENFCLEKYKVAKTFYEKHPKMTIMLLALIIVVLVMIVLCACLTSTKSGKFSRDYYCKISSDHTMCKYQKISSVCNKVIKVGLSKEEKQKLVDVHNELRNRVALGNEDAGKDGPQPSASNMQKMIWDDQIAEIAQRWAEQCLGGHDKNRGTGRISLGQNYCGGGNTGNDSPDYLSCVTNGWYHEEVKLFSSKYIKPFYFEKYYGHYSQYVWAESYLLGCGYINHAPDLKWDTWKKWHLVCNYGNQGNFIGSTMYKVGKPASDCKNGTSQDATYTGLCSYSRNTCHKIISSLIFSCFSLVVLYLI